MHTQVPRAHWQYTAYQHLSVFARLKTARRNPGGHATSYLDTIIGNANAGNTGNEGNTNKG